MTEQPPLPPPGTASPGLVLAGRYRLDRLLAVGGMAEVWEAQDQLLGRPVAVKVLHRHLAADPSFVERFRTEAIAAARLHHPGIVAVFDTCTDQGIEAIVLELVPGHTLREHLDQTGPLALDDAVDIAIAVADALAVAHDAGLVHRDVKPANILLCDDDRVMITDFGIAKVVDTTDRTATGTMLGSVKYLSPEQVEGHVVDGRSDLFSLAIVVHEMLTGAPPWLSEAPAATALARLHTAPPPVTASRPDLGPEVDRVLRTALAVDPDARPPDAAALRRSLQGLTTGSSRPTTDPDATTVVPAPVATPPTDGAGTDGSARHSQGAPATPPPTPPAGATSPPGRRRWAAAGVLALLAAAGLAVTAALVLDSGTGRELGERFVPEVGDAGPEAPLSVTATAYDPEGTAGENDGEAPLAVDGDPDTAWTSEGYDSASLPPLKRGMGLVLDLGGRHEVGSLDVRTANDGWSAEVYAADEVADSVDGWGPPVATISDAAPVSDVVLDEVEASHLLVWFTHLGGADPTGEGDGRYRAVVVEVAAHGR